MLGWLDYEDKHVLGIAPHSGRKSSMKSTVKSTWPNANNLFFAGFASQAQFNPVPNYKWFLIVLWVSIPSKIQTCRWSQTFSSNILSCNLNSPSFNSNIQLVNSNLQFGISNIQFGNSNILRSLGTRKGHEGLHEAVLLSSSRQHWVVLHWNFQLLSRK